MKFYLKLPLIIFTMFFFTSCSSDFANLLIVSSTEPKIQTSESINLAGDKNAQIPGTFHYEVRTSDDSTDLDIQIQNKKYRIKIGSEGYYLCNLTDETLVASKLKYEDEMDQYLIPIPDPKMDSIREAEDPNKTQKMVILEKGKSALLTKSLHVNVYGLLQDAPMGVEFKSNAVPVFYQLYTLKGYQELVNEEIQKMIKEKK